MLYRKIAALYGKIAVHYGKIAVGYGKKVVEKSCSATSSAHLKCAGASL